MHLSENGKTVYTIGYKYNLRKVLSFSSTPGMGSSLPEKPYETWWYERHGNFHFHYTPRPQIISSFFDHSHIIDMRNHARQCVLAFWKRLR